MRRVVISGVGPVSPVGVGKQNFWEAVRRGTSGIVALEHLPLDFDPARLRSRIAAAVPAELLPPAITHRNRQIGMGLLAAELAMADAGLSSLKDGPGAVVVGTAVGGTADMEELFFEIGSDPSLAPELREAMSFHSLAARVAECFEPDLAPLTISTGCTAGLDSLGLAYEIVRDAKADVVLVGAAEAPLTPVVFAAFDVIGALSTRNDEPQAASRPFDAARDGFVLGEGAAFLVIEERTSALRRGATIYAEISGYASSCNSYHMTDLPEHGRDLAACISSALIGAGLDADSIDAVNAHGSSTQQNDLCETNALKSSLNGRAYKIPVNSLKSMIGHALGASNAIEAVACALEIRDQFVFPTINLDNPGLGCDLDYVPARGRSQSIRNLLKLSNGFSGIHSALVFSTLS